MVISVPILYHFKNCEQSLYFDLLSFFILFFLSFQFFQYQRNTPDFKYYVKLFTLPITIAVVEEAHFFKKNLGIVPSFC